MLDDRVTEAAFLADVKRLAQLTGWRTFHNLDARGSDKGWPDLAICRGGTLHLMELKRERGRVRPEQADWLEDLGSVVRVTAGVYRPADWHRIVGMLKGEIE